MNLPFNEDFWLDFTNFLFVLFLKIMFSQLATVQYILVFDVVFLNAYHLATIFPTLHPSETLRLFLVSITRGTYHGSSPALISPPLDIPPFLYGLPCYCLVFTFNRDRNNLKVKSVNSCTVQLIIKIE